MSSYSLFTDGSVNPALKVGVGGYLLLPQGVIEKASIPIDKGELETIVVLKRFEKTSSTQLEVETLLWALTRISPPSPVATQWQAPADFLSVEALDIVSTMATSLSVEKNSRDLPLRPFTTNSGEKCGLEKAPLSPGDQLTVYTDSQCISGLLSRRKRLESRGFKSRGSGQLLKHASLYTRYYQLCDQWNFEVIKVKGHSPSHSRGRIEQIFSILDQKVRKSLKGWVIEQRNPS